MLATSRVRPVSRSSPTTATRSVAHSSATVAAWTLISRITGLLRVVAIGAVLGPTYLANTFLATNNVPNLTYSLVAGPVLALVVVPAVVRALLERDRSGSADYVRRLSGLLVGASAAVAVLLVPAAFLLARALTAGVSGEEQAAAHRIAVVLLLLVAPQVVLYTVAALGAAVQQARERYALAAGAPALENVGLMVTMAVIALRHRPGADVGEASADMVLTLGVGATASVALHAAVQAYGASRAGLSIRPARGWRSDPDARAVAGRLRKAVPVALLPAGAFFLLLTFSATMPGGALVFQMAYTVYAVPVALGARAVTTAVLPSMSAAAQTGDRSRYAAGWRTAASYATVAGLPATCLLILLAGAVAAILSAGELHGSVLVGWLAVGIAVLGVAQPAAAMQEIGRQALFARLDTRGPRLSVAVSFAVTAVAGAGALLLPEGPLRLAGLCAAVLLADAAGALVILVLLRRIIRPEPLLDLRRVGAAVAAAVAMVPVLATGRALTENDGATVRDLAVLGPAAVLAIVVFALVLAGLTRRRGATA